MALTAGGEPRHEGPFSSPDKRCTLSSKGMWVAAKRDQERNGGGRRGWPRPSRPQAGRENCGALAPFAPRPPPPETVLLQPLPPLPCVWGGRTPIQWGSSSSSSPQEARARRGEQPRDCCSLESHSLESQPNPQPRWLFWIIGQGKKQASTGVWIETPCFYYR